MRHLVPTLLALTLLAACMGPPRPRCIPDRPASLRGPTLDARLAELKTDLRLVPAQEPAWATFVEGLKAPAAPPPEEKPASGPGGPRAMRAETDGARAAYDRFYAALTAEQRQTMDESLARPAPACPTTL